MLMTAPAHRCRGVLKAIVALAISTLGVECQGMTLSLRVVLSITLCVVDNTAMHAGEMKTDEREFDAKY